MISEHGTLKSYFLGLTLSVLLTLAAYFSVTEHFFSGMNLIFVILGLGCLQTLVQLVLFLHLGSESKPYWNIAMFLFMASILVTLVFGSMWIMSNLNYRMMGM